MFEDEETNNEEIQFFQGSYVNESFLIPGVRENDIYTFGVNESQDVDISVVPNGGDVELELYRDSNNNLGLDTTDELIARSDEQGTEVLDNILTEGTYFINVGLITLNKGNDQLVYEIEIDNDDNDLQSPTLFEENTNNYSIAPREVSYSRESLLIPGVFEHEIYSFRLKDRQQVDIAANPDGGDIQLELYRDSNKNGRLDTADELVARSNKRDTEVLDKQLAKGNYFVHVDLLSLNGGEDQLVYQIEIDTADNDPPPSIPLFNNNVNNFLVGIGPVTGSSSSDTSSPLFTENTDDYDVEFRDNSYRDNNTLIPNQSEHHIYTFEIEEQRDIDIFVFPSGGSVLLELYQDTNNNQELDEEDNLITNSDRNGNQSLTEVLEAGTYFVHVGLFSDDNTNGSSDNTEELEYRIRINSNVPLDMSTSSEEIIPTNTLGRFGNTLFPQELGQNLDTVNNLFDSSNLNFSI